MHGLSQSGSGGLHKVFATFSLFYFIISYILLIINTTDFYLFYSLNKIITNMNTFVSSKNPYIVGTYT